MKKFIKFLLLTSSLFVFFPLFVSAQTELSLLLFNEFTGEAASDTASYSISSAGDVNGDGYDDILIGAPANDDAGSDVGAAYLIYGSASPLTSASLSTAVEFTGEAAWDTVGQSVSSAGDVNNDGYDDILVGAAYNHDGGSDAGAAYLIYGSSTLLTSASLSTAVEFTGEASGNVSGSSVSSAGDVNNDGYDDILIGAYGNDDAALNAGAVYLIYGSGTLLTSVSLSSAVEFTGEAASDFAGSSVSSAGDVNNDGYDDILIGAHSNDDAGSDAGAAYLIYGSSEEFISASLSTAIEFTGTEEIDYAGKSVSSAGDVNGDGHDDLLIGAAWINDIGSDAGSAYLIYGSDTALTSTSLSTADEFIGEAASDWAGRSVSSAGDVNNDGYDDILIGATNNDDAASNAGAAYLGYVYIDSDHDGVPGTAGLFAGTDCNDADATVSTDQTYYEDADNDSYGSTTAAYICSSTPPAGYAANDTDCNDEDITVNTNQTYYQDSDNDQLGNLDQTTSVCSSTSPSGYVINTLDTDDTRVDILLQYETDSAYYLDLYSQGKKLSLLNLTTNESLATITLSKKKKYAKNSLKLLTYRHKKLAVIVSKKKAKILTSLVYPNITSEKLTKKDQEKLSNKNIKPNKTKKRNNYLQLRNKKGKILEQYFVNKKYELIIK